MCYRLGEQFHGSDFKHLVSSCRVFAIGDCTVDFAAAIRLKGLDSVAAFISQLCAAHFVLISGSIMIVSILVSSLIRVWLSGSGNWSEFHMGVDGISLPMMLLYSHPDAVGDSSLLQYRRSAKMYMFLFLLLETAMLGLFATLDLTS